jgi:hypothetical protein
LRSRRGLFGSLAFLLALPLAGLLGMMFGLGGEALIHAALALGAALMAFAVADFETPRWAAWLGAGSMGVLAAVFFLQGLSEVTHDASLARLAYGVLGQGLEARLVDLFMAWCVVLLVMDERGTKRTLGIVAMATVACATLYSLSLVSQGTSLAAEAPMLRLLWLLPFVWILCESTAGKEPRPA